MILIIHLLLKRHPTFWWPILDTHDNEVVYAKCVCVRVCSVSLCGNILLSMSSFPSSSSSSCSLRRHATGALARLLARWLSFCSGISSRASTLEPRQRHARLCGAVRARKSGQTDVKTGV